mgnify:CR=1 FL=1
MASIKRRRANTMLSITISMRTERKNKNGNRLTRRQKRNTAKPKSSTNKVPEPLLPPAKQPLPRSLRIL